MRGWYLFSLKIKNKMKKTIIIITVLSGLALFIGWHLVWFGSLTRNCIYTEEKIPVPILLSDGKLITTQKSFEVIGLESPDMSCSLIYSSIARELISTENSELYEGLKSVTVKEISAGKVFRVVDAFTQTKHGISTIDSGPGPIELLILEDEQGVQYFIPPGGFGVNPEGRFLKFISADKGQLLDSSAFYEVGVDGQQTGFDGLKFFHLDGSDSTEDSIPRIPPVDYSNYDVLRKSCDSDCCRNSVDYMKKNGYHPMLGDCPKGFKQNINSCAGGWSLAWCEPV